MRRYPATLATVLAATLLAACGDGHVASPAPPPQEAGPSTLKVMTQNLYLGADLDLLVSSTDLPATVQQLWANMLSTDFPERAKVLADAIQAASPDVIALQEVTLWRFQAPGDFATFPFPNATTVQVDFLAVLLGELQARGASFDVVGISTNADFELPGSSGVDYRLTDRDVILRKPSVPVTATATGTFTHLATLALTLPGGSTPVPVQIRRGWVSADLRAGGKTVRLFDTHLEAFSADVASQQVGELLAAADPGARPTVIAGDMNLPPTTGGYAQFLASGTRLRDAWSAVNGADPGLSCCWNPDLRGGTLQTRIDLVFATPELRPTAATLLEIGARTPSGLSPSDHLGVTATFDAAGAGTPAATMATR